MDVVVLSGGFDPIHDGHISMFREASEKYDHVLVGINSDAWLTRKKGRPFMSYDVRKSIVQSIKYVDEVIGFNDDYDNACDLLEYAIQTHSNVTFGNGGDRTGGNFPELDYCKLNDIQVDDTLGGSTKMNSSSDFLADWKFQPTDRDWGLWKVLSDYGTCKVKELVVNPRSSLSWQTHEHRSEVWFVREGVATVYFSLDDEGNHVRKTYLAQDETMKIYKHKWHKLVNEGDVPLSVIEIQYGEMCVESDILRAPLNESKALPA